MYFAPYMDASGIHIPTYEDRLQALLSAYRSVFGQDVRLTEASPDYQLLSVFARALDDFPSCWRQALPPGTRTTPPGRRWTCSPRCTACGGTAPPAPR